MKQLTLEINERQEEEELQVNIYIHIYIRVFHENMFFKKKIIATHHASAWGLV